jgi:hypothetical protein
MPVVFASPATSDQPYLQLLGPHVTDSTKRRNRGRNGTILPKLTLCRLPLKVKACPEFALLLRPWPDRRLNPLFLTGTPC